jgi:hypothetical protein
MSRGLWKVGATPPKDNLVGVGWAQGLGFRGSHPHEGGSKEKEGPGPSRISSGSPRNTKWPSQWVIGKGAA